MKRIPSGCLLFEKNEWLHHPVTKAAHRCPIRYMRVASSAPLRRTIFGMGVLGIVILGCCAFFRISGSQDIKAYVEMARECHPVWKQFAFRRFGAADSAKELLR